jgi:guanylate kinase
MKRYPGQLFILSGPSGVGKTSVDGRLRERMPRLGKIVTYTTREPRPHEKNGVHYHFVTKRHFQEMIEHHEFLEWAVVHTHLYGTPKKQVLDFLAKGVHVLLVVDVQGAMRIHEQLPHDTHLIFIEPDNMRNLETHLMARKASSAGEIKVRLEDARKEMAYRDQYDYLVINRESHIDEAVQDIGTIIKNVSKTTKS